MRSLIDQGPIHQHAEWIRQYGSTFQYTGFLGQRGLFTTDLAALSFVLHHVDAFPKTRAARSGVFTLMGQGLIFSEGAQHRKQRRILNSSFNLTSVKKMGPVFFDKAERLKEKWCQLIEEAKTEDQTDGIESACAFDVLPQLQKVIWDILGVTGFDYEFDTLGDSYTELADAHTNMFAMSQRLSAWDSLWMVFPFMRNLVSSTSRLYVRLTVGQPSSKHQRFFKSRNAARGVAKVLSIRNQASRHCIDG